MIFAIIILILILLMVLGWYLYQKPTQIGSIKVTLERKAVISLTWGIASIVIIMIPMAISILGDLSLFLNGVINLKEMLMSGIMLTGSWLLIIPIPLLALFGIIFGIHGLHSTKKNIARTGIILCLLSWLTSWYLFIIAFCEGFHAAC